ncbi:MAG: hypothetical protein ABIJ16_02675, partial [Bacteroidota bacterium]
NDILAMNEGEQSRKVYDLKRGLAILMELTRITGEYDEELNTELTEVFEEYSGKAQQLISE